VKTRPNWISTLPNPATGEPIRLIPPASSATRKSDRYKVLVDINEDLLVTNSDNYVYLDTHCYGILFYLWTEHSKKILNLVLIHQVPMYKIVFAFYGRLRLIPAQELYDKDDVKPIIIIE